jgi:tetratricopeptide (TPR) repeat protein
LTSEDDTAELSRQAQERLGRAQERLRRAQELHGEGRIDEALAEARGALDADPESTAAMTYLGTTLITRRLRFAEGLEVLEHAAAQAPEDAGVQYSLGWCQEFVAYRLSKQSTRPYRDPFELWEDAAASLQRCIDLDPEPGLKADAEDLLVSIVARLE